MRPRLRPQRTDAKRWRRSAVVLALGMAAFGAGLIVPGGAAGQANCTLPNTPTNDSCVKLVVTPSNAPPSFGNSQLFLRWRTTYTNPANKAQGGFPKTVTLLFDNDFRFTPGPIPKCAPSELLGKDIAGAWEQCGPGADGNPPSEGNAYLSPPTAVSGTISTVGSNPFFGNFAGCSLVFNGPTDANGNPTVTLFLHLTSGHNQPANCANPASNHADIGAGTLITVGTITNAGVAGFGKKLTVRNLDQGTTLALDDFYATLRRHITATSSYFQARCPAGASPWKLRGIFAYSGGPPSPEPTDTVNSTQPCS